MMGRRRQRRVPIHHPGSVFFWAGILLCVTVGLVAAGVYESWTAGDWGWCAFFLAGEVGAIILYFWIVWSWTVWMHRTVDSNVADENVGSFHGPQGSG